MPFVCTISEKIAPVTRSFQTIFVDSQFCCAAEVNFEKQTQFFILNFLKDKPQQKQCLQGHSLKMPSCSEPSFLLKSIGMVLGCNSKHSSHLVECLKYQKHSQKFEFQFPSCRVCKDAGSQSVVNVWQHTLGGQGSKALYRVAAVAAASFAKLLSWHVVYLG